MTDLAAPHATEARIIAAGQGAHAVGRAGFRQVFVFHEIVQLLVTRYHQAGNRILIQFIQALAVGG